MSKNNKEILVLVTGIFNVLHPGHQRLLKFAKDTGTKLIVGIESNKLAGKAAQVDEKIRLEGVKNLSIVDEVIIFDNDIEVLIATIKPNFIVKGKEHEKRFNPEEEAIKKVGGSLLFSSGEVFFCYRLLNDNETKRYDFKNQVNI